MFVGRNALKLMLMLHPPSFRKQFGQEMLLDYSDRSGDHAACLNFLDAGISLVRQWLHAARDYQESDSRELVTFLTCQSALAFQRPMTLYELSKGFLLSSLLFSTFWYVEDPLRAGFSQLLTSPQALWANPATAREGRINRQIIIEDVTIVDLNEGRLLAHKNVVIENGFITAVEASIRHHGSSHADTVDGRGKFLMPGMWDMHSHITHTEVDFPLYIANGVLGIRSMGGVQDQVFAWNAKLKDGSLFGPTAFVSGPILDGPGGPV